jgi:hypothetical protein
MHHRQRRRVHVFSGDPYKYMICNKEKSPSTWSVPAFMSILCMATHTGLLNSGKHQADMLDLFYPHPQFHAE